MTDQHTLYHNGQQVNMLYRWVRESHTLENIPDLVKRIIREEMWKAHLFEKTGEVFRFTTFQEFVETHPPDGLNTTIERLQYLCREDPEAQELIDQAIQKKAKTLLRAKSLTIPSNPKKAAKALRKHFSEKELHTLIQCLEECEHMP